MHRSPLSLLLLSLLLLGCAGEERMEVGLLWEGGEAIFELAIADAPDERRRGLMNRTREQVGDGMLFIFEEQEQRSFWMHDTLVALDLLFIDEHGRIVHLVEGAQPCPELPCPSIPSVQPTRFVVELPATSASAHAIPLGAQLLIDGQKPYK